MDHPRPPFSQAPAMVPMMPPMMVPTPIPPTSNGGKPGDSRSPSAPVPPQNLVWCYNPSLMMPPAVRMFMPMMGVGGPMVAPPMMMAPMMPMMPIPPPAALPVPASAAIKTERQNTEDDAAPLDLSKKPVKATAVSPKTETNHESDRKRAALSPAAHSGLGKIEIKNEPTTAYGGSTEGPSAKPCYKKNILKRYQGEFFFNNKITLTKKGGTNAKTFLNKE